MKRRDFIKKSSLASGTLLIPDFLKASDILLPANGTRKLVIIELNGGNDWLNTVIPYRNDIYRKLRPKIAVPENKVIPLVKELGFHPELTALKALFESGEMSILNSVGYPDPDRSHFRSLDIWHSASSGKEYIDTGWLGRYLDLKGKNAFEVMQSGIEISLALKGNSMSGIAVQNLKQLDHELQKPFYSQLIAAVGNETLKEKNHAYLYRTLIQTRNGIDHLLEKSRTEKNFAEYPNTGIARQLRQTASLIAADCSTRVYYLSMNGFDTHASQTERQGRLLKMYAEAVTSFVSDLKGSGHWNDTLILTFSEFGRRVEENASGGTDHGTAGNVFLFGAGLKQKGMVNNGPDLGDLDDGDLKFSVDFRSIYKDILQNWMGAASGDIIPASVRSLSLV